jgi:hypothetical protein
MTHAQIKALQRELNDWTDKWLKGVDHLAPDGVKGRDTNARIMGIKYYLGYGKHRDGELTSHFARRRRHPRDPRYSSPQMIATGIARRRRQRKRYEQAHAAKDDNAWGGSRYFTNRAIRIAARHGVGISRRKWSGPPINGNWGSDHNVWNTTADAVDLPTFEGLSLAHEIARDLGASYEPGSWNISYVKRPDTGVTYRIQILWHAPDGSHTDHVHVGAKRQ